MTYLGAIKQLHELRAADDMPIYYKPAIAKVIETLLMDAQEVKHGRWELVNRPDEGFWVCSCCMFPSEAFAANVLYKFCPNCGARMGGDAE